tara:strand:- start:41 stop:889 length:849 start_codon:yes stop_codon:yes gene_type:complete
MNVVSYFDGISCGQIALDKLNIEVSNYFAYEIDEKSISITQRNYPKTKQMGSVVDADLSILPIIDLLIGGSPCQGFSSSGKKLNFEDPRSKLFFEFVKAKEILKPKYFFLENVVMKKEYKDIISKYLGCEPIVINSSLVSAQNRVRLYWTNIPNIAELKDRNITVKTSLGIDKPIGQMQAFPRNYKKLGLKRVERFEERTDSKSNCCLARSDKNLYKTDNGLKKLTVKHYEILQGIPLEYTKGECDSQRYKMIGNGWNIDTVIHFFKELPYSRNIGGFLHCG